MAAFRYRAMDAAGRPQSGMIEAATQATARQSLRAQGLLPLDLAPGTVARRVGQATSAARLSGSALTLVTRQMATLLRAGLRIEEALQTVAGGQPPRVAGLLLTLRASVMEGRTFAAALGDFPRAFGEYYLASVRAGEASGRLDQVMAHLAGFVETRARNRQSVQLALLYPALLALVSLAIITALMVFVVPDIVRVFRDRGADLPFLTRALIGISQGIRQAGLPVALVLVIAVLLLSRLARVPARQLALHGWLATARPTRRLVQRMNAAQFAGTLATLLIARVPLVEALASAAGVTPNRHIRARIMALTDKVRQGMSLHRAMAEAAVFPPMMLAMVASGEAGADLGAALDHAATDVQRDLDGWVRAVVALVEPAILLVMGGLVLVLVLAILMPIISLNGLAS